MDAGRRRREAGFGAVSRVMGEPSTPGSTGVPGQFSPRPGQGSVQTCLCALWFYLVFFFFCVYH
jgi:hypothetical protein